MILLSQQDGIIKEIHFRNNYNSSRKNYMTKKGGKYKI